MSSSTYQHVKHYHVHVHHIIIIISSLKRPNIYECSGRNNETGLEASRKARAATAEWAAGVQPPPPTNPPLPPLISKRVYPCARRERERKAGRHAQPDTTQGPGRKEVPPGRKDQSRQDQANSPPRHRRRPDLVLVAGHTRK